MNTTSLHPNPPERHRFHVLDALRGIAAIMVVNLHTASVVNRTGFVRNAYLAVDFFFCLSGFVIAFAYERRLREGFALRSFMSARFIRLYPMLFLGMTIGLAKTLVLQVQRFDVHVLEAKSAFFLQGILLIPNLSPSRNIVVFPLDNAAWSLFFELLINFVFAVAVYRRRADNRVLSLAALISLGVLSHAIWKGTPLLYMGSVSSLYPFLLGFARVTLPFATGVLVFRLHRKFASGSHHGPSRYMLAVVVIAILSLILISPFVSMQSPLFYMLVLSVAWPCLIFFGAKARVPRALEGLCSALGELSYPLYLLNVVLNYVFAKPSLMMTAHWPQLRPLMVSTITIADVVIAFAVARWLDAPVRKLITRRYNNFLVTSRVDLAQPHHLRTRP